MAGSSKVLVEEMGAVLVSIMSLPIECQPNTGVTTIFALGGREAS